MLFNIWAWAVISYANWARILLGQYGKKTKKADNNWAKKWPASTWASWAQFNYNRKNQPMGQLDQIHFYDNYFRHTTCATPHATLGPWTLVIIPSNIL